MHGGISRICLADRPGFFIADSHAPRGVFGEFLPFAQFVFLLERAGDVDEREGDPGRLIPRRPVQTKHANKQNRAVRATQLQFTFLIPVMPRHALKIVVPTIKILGGDETREMTVLQLAEFLPQQCSTGKIHFSDQSFSGQGEVANQSEFIEGCIVVTGFFQNILYAPQFLVLHLQSDLMHLEFMQEALWIGLALFGLALRGGFLDQDISFLVVAAHCYLHRQQNTCFSEPERQSRRRKCSGPFETEGIVSGFQDVAVAGDAVKQRHRHAGPGNYNFLPGGVGNTYPAPHKVFWADAILQLP